MKHEQHENVNTKDLDQIADFLEQRGMLKEAHDVDVISNTLERVAFQWWDKMRGKMKADPYIVRPLENIRSKSNVLLDVISSPKEFDAYEAEKMIRSMRQNLDTLSAAISATRPKAKMVREPIDQAMKQVGQKSVGAPDEFVQ